MSDDRDLGRLAYETFAETIGISDQRPPRGDLNSPRMKGAVPWGELPSSARARWRIVAVAVEAAVLEARASLERQVLAAALAEKGATLERQGVHPITAHVRGCTACSRDPRTGRIVACEELGKIG